MSGEMDINSSDNMILYRGKIGHAGTSSEQFTHKHIPRIFSYTFLDNHSILQILKDGAVLTADNLKNHDHYLSLFRPILITDSPESIGMKIPKGGKKENNNHHRITLTDIGNIIGMEYPVTVMDVSTQEEMEGWTFEDLVGYFEDRNRINSSTTRMGSRQSDLILNQISLEFSLTPLRKMTLSPSFVRELDWIDIAWPKQHKHLKDFPQVQYYCLTSTAGSYTDFHVDFGGTSVWYHGRLIRPIYAEYHFPLFMC